jgi:hypothetical protein
MRRAAVALLFCCSIGVAACGSPRGKPPNLDVPAPPAPLVSYADPTGDVTFSYPENWPLQPMDPPGIAIAATGGASATFWAYRSVSLVVDPATAAKALQRFLASLAQRDPGFKVTATDVTFVFNKPAFTVEGTTTIAGRPTQVRSVHAFNGVGEYVLDMLADPDKFARINTSVFQPMLVSWKFLGTPPPVTDQGVAGSASPTVPPS